MRKIVVFVTAFLSLGASAAAQRLSGGVVPTQYTLWFAPDLEKATFRGRETIRVDLKSPTAAVTLHAAEIQFGEVTITAGGATQTARVTLDEKNETATLTVSRALPQGGATIQITYTGILNDKLRGFYLSKANGRRYAVSQMEATDARRAFPSFDEPAYKATFDISMLIDTGDTAISNGRQVSDTPGPEPGKHTVRFAPTAKMSTYLVALLVGDFVCRQGAADRVPIRVCSTPDKLPLTAFALEAAQQEVKFYNEFTGIPYPFGKLDIIGVPDFAAGAMENTGAITFREEYLFADPKRASLGTRKTVASVISHEIAHMWFGDLVTMKWWDDIWLNEGFATWMAPKPLAAWHPEWKVELDEVQEAQAAIATDALRSTRAIRTKVETPEEINEVFDAIAYQKTASVLRTIETFVGPELFRKGVSSYLRKFSYANAAGEDFWTEVARVTGKPVDRIMKPYIEQPGVPVVSVDARCTTTTTTEIVLRQDQFVGIPTAIPSSASTLWTIPVCFKTPGGGSPRCEVLDRRDQKAALSACAVPLFANPNGRGYYLSEYSPEEVRALGRTARTALAPSERMNLLGDEWWMIRAGRNDIGVYLDLASSLAGDDVAPVTQQIGGALSFTSEYIVKPTELQRFQEWVRERFSPELNALGLPGNAADGDEAQARRAALLSLIGVTGNSAEVQVQARALALKYISDRQALPATLASTVLNVAALGGDATLYDLYLAQLPKLSGQPEEYYRFFGGLTWFRDPALVQRTLQFAVSPEVRTQDTSQLIGGLLARPWSREAAWTFVRTRWDTLTQLLGTFQGIPGIVRTLGSFCSRERATEVKDFFAAHPVPAADRTLRQSIERIENCAAVAERQAPAMSIWLASAAR